MDTKTKTQEAGARADWLVHQAFPQLTGRQVEEAIENGLVKLVGGGSLKKGRRLAPDQTLDCGALEDRLEALKQGNPGLVLTVVHEETGFWIVDKPAGMPGHPLRLHESETVTHWALARDPGIQRHFPLAQPTLTPHRLDTGTSGLLIVARTEEAYAAWRERFDQKEVRKVYLAWCWGIPHAEEWLIDASIGKDKGPSARMAVDGKEARPAISRVRVLTRLSDRFLAEVECETGVTHQVRLHLAHSGHPLLGDRGYDPDFESRPAKPSQHLLRAVLLAWSESVYEADRQAFESQFS